MLVFVSGSSRGIGLLTVKELIHKGHQVVAHARDESKAEAIKLKAPGVHAVVVGDFENIKEIYSVARQLNDIGTFHTIIHNAGIGHRVSRRSATPQDISRIFQVNVLASYMICALVGRAEKYIWLSAGTHRNVQVDITDINWTKRDWDPYRAYVESKFYDATLGFSLSKIWPQSRSYIVEPGWVPTDLGGPLATESLTEGYLTQVWLTETPSQKTDYYYHKRPMVHHQDTHDDRVQQALLDECRRLSGISLENRITSVFALDH